MDDRTYTRRRACASFALFTLLALLPVSAVRAAPVVPATECDVTKNAQGVVLEGDAGDSMATATPLSIPAVCRGTLTASSDEQDWYRFEETSGRDFAITIVSEAPLFATGVKVLNSRGQLVMKEDVPVCMDAAQKDECTLSAALAVFNDTFYLVLTREVGSGTYDLRADGSQPQHDCGPSGDAGVEPFGLTEFDKPRPLTLYESSTANVRTVTCAGNFEKADPSDGFSFFLPLGSVLEIDLTGMEKQPTLSKVSLKDPQDGDLLSECAREGDTSRVFGKYTCKFGSMETHISGTYVLQLDAGYARQAGPVAYGFSLKIRQDDCFDIASVGDQGDAPDAVATPADRVLFGGSCRGALDAARAEPADDPSTPAIENRPAVALDPVDRLAVMSDTGTLNFQVLPPLPNCITLSITPPGTTTPTSRTECSGVTPFAVTGGSGLWAIDVFYAGQAPGAPSDTYPGGKYEVTVIGAVPFQGDCGTAGDVTTHEIPVPARTDEAGVLTQTREEGCSGDIRTAGDVDTYTLPGVAVSDIVEIELGESDTTQVCLVDPLGATRGCGRTVSARADTAALAGTWRAQVKGPAPLYLATYALTVRVLSQSDCSSARDGGNTAATATALPQAVTPADTVTGEALLELQACVGNASAVPGVRINGQLRHLVQDTADWYSVTLLTEYTALSAVLVQETLGDPRTAADFDLCVIPPGGQIKCSFNPPSVPEVVVATPVCPIPQGPEVPTCGGTGEWKVGVVRRAGPLGAYRLAIAGRN